MQVMLVMPVVGSNGRMAHAHVQSAGPGKLEIQVQLPGGHVVRIDPDDNDYLEHDDDEFGPKGRVIDADWREVR